MVGGVCYHSYKYAMREGLYFTQTLKLTLRSLSAAHTWSRTHTIHLAEVLQLNKQLNSVVTSPVNAVSLSWLLHTCMCNMYYIVTTCMHIIYTHQYMQYYSCTVCTYMYVVLLQQDKSRSRNSSRAKEQVNLSIEVPLVQYLFKGTGTAGTSGTFYRYELGTSSYLGQIRLDQIN